jgi:hypothetical protein
MRTFKLFSISVLFLSFLIVTMSSFKKPNFGEQLTITNKTGSDIDEIHVGDSGDILDEDEILEPGESVTLEFDCAGLHADVEATIHLIFEDDTEYSFDDTVCDGDYAWDILDDGKE